MADETVLVNFSFNIQIRHPTLNVMPIVHYRKAGSSQTETRHSCGVTGGRGGGGGGGLVKGKDQQVTCQNQFSGVCVSTAWTISETELKP